MLRRSLHVLGVVVLALLMSGVFGVRSAAAASAVTDEQGPKVSVVIVAKAAGADESVLAYDIIATNHEGAFARNLTITVPFNADALKLVDVKFSGEAAWVSELGAKSFSYTIDGLHKNHPNTATVRFAKLANAAKDAG